MSADTLFALVLFAFATSITPGPTNILVLSNSARFGLMAAVPIILGACASAAILVLLVGTGAGTSLIEWPEPIEHPTGAAGRSALRPGRSGPDH